MTPQMIWPETVGMAIEVIESATFLTGEQRTGTTAPARTPVPDGQDRRRTPEAQRNSELRVMGREVVVAVTNGRLDFGPWEQILYGEIDGRRRKRVLVKVIGGQVAADHG